MFIIKLNTDSSWEQANIKEDDLYKQVREIIGGWVEEVKPKRLPDPYVMLVDSDGRLKGLNFNPIASLVYGFAEHGTPIVGEVVIAKRVMTADGYEAKSLSFEDTKIIEKYLKSIVG